MKPKFPVGKVEIEFVGIFDADKVPKHAYLLQKIQMYAFMVALPCFIIAFWIVILKK